MSVLRKFIAALHQTMYKHHVEQLASSIAAFFMLFTQRTDQRPVRINHDPRGADHMGLVPFYRSL